MYSTRTFASDDAAKRLDDLKQRGEVRREKTPDDIAAENKRKCAVTVRKFRNLSWLYERGSK